LADLLIFIAFSPIAAKALFKKFFIQEVIGNAVPHTAKIDVDCNKKNCKQATQARGYYSCAMPMATKYLNIA
jgi:hypothetical protein